MQGKEEVGIPCYWGVAEDHGIYTEKNPVTTNFIHLLTTWNS